MDIKVRTEIIIKEFNNKLVEREHIVPMILLALYSQQHMLLLGPPGVGKTYAVELIKHFVKDVKYFEYLITPTTTIDELFGTKVIEADGSTTYLIENSMLDSHIVFNDEIFKGPSQLLNSQLGITHSSRSFFQRGRGKLKSPMLSMFAASNELPDNDAVDAFDDRLLFRFWVDEISDPGNFERFVKREFDRTQEFSVSMTIDEIRDIKIKASSIFIHDDFVEFFALIKAKLKDEKVRVSDRKSQSSLDIFQVSAYVNNRSSVDISDLFLLLDIAWKHYDDIDRVKRVVFNSVFGNLSNTIEVLKLNQDAYKSYLSQLRSQVGNVLNYTYNFYGTHSEQEFNLAKNDLEVIASSLQQVQTNCRSIIDNFTFVTQVEDLIKENIFIQNYKNHIYIDGRSELVGDNRVNKNELFSLQNDLNLILNRLNEWLSKNTGVYEYNNNKLVIQR